MSVATRLNVSYLRALGVIFLFLTGACSPSPSPNSVELIKTAVPTFDGAESYSATTSTPAYVLSGDCDTKSYGLEYSYDQTSWVLLSNDCTTGRFSINLVVRKILDVYVRAKTKMGHTAAAKATIRFVLPPTSPSFQFVSSGNAVDGIDRKVQFTSGLVGSEVQTSSPSFNLHTGITGMVYSDP